MADTERIRARIGKRVQLSAELVKAMGVSPEAYTRVALNALIVNPKIAECTPDSIDAALLRCIEIGLLPDGKHAAIVPFAGKAQLVVMVDGKAYLARKAMPGLALRARVVYAGEDFEHREGLDAVLQHWPDDTVPRSGEHVKAAYAIADLPGGGKEFVVVYRSDIERARQMSRAQRADSPWSKWYAEMAEKTAMHRLLKRLPTIPDAPPDFDEIEQEAAPAQDRVVGPALPAPDPDAYIPQPAETAAREPEPVPVAQPAAAEPLVQGVVDDSELTPEQEAELNDSPF